MGQVSCGYSSGPPPVPPGRILMESIWLLTQHGDRAHRVNAEGTSLDEHQQLAGEHHRLRHIHLAHLGVMERREEGARVAPVGREVIFGAVTYHMAHSNQPDSPDGS